MDRTPSSLQLRLYFFFLPPALNWAENGAMTIRGFASTSLKWAKAGNLCRTPLFLKTLTPFRNFKKQRLKIEMPNRLLEVYMGQTKKKSISGIDLFKVYACMPNRG
eukprot:TRINITY_DN2099_c3_g1_i1.p1 TRINITY_DN2099_c3_g1~~TRINITY_DN2099_c3_g1_i1.p1  ORF type:complete len:106 (+),score=10.89 TRINITY_DN2099_c3_g1_i1:942-1259(+)